MTVAEAAKRVTARGVPMTPGKLTRLVAEGLIAISGRDGSHPGKSRIVLPGNVPDILCALEIARRMWGLSYSQLKSSRDRPKDFARTILRLGRMSLCQRIDQHAYDSILSARLEEIDAALDVLTEGTD